jgi:aminoglycoside 6'-N-acetyltransferase I
VIIRKLGEPDFDEWARMRIALWPHLDAEECLIEMRRMLADPDRVVIFVSEHSVGRLQGFIEAGFRDVAQDCTTSPVGYIEGWFVDPEARRAGVGRALVEAAENWARAKGCQEMASDTHVANTLSQQAHRRLGYEPGPPIIPFRKSLH